jgi:hypothetical protein
VNCAISTIQIKFRSKTDREMEENNKIPIMAKIKYMANFPTARFVASTVLT